ncbi:MAG: hypothetical protein HY699_06565 [Deltaproteobacteria bacterium]|nr:hypothetical protein [Deltaproteobacteria bacterium]
MKKWIMPVLLVSLLMAPLLLASPASAVRGGPCAEDAEKFCKGLERGGGRVIGCLKEHLADLSAACKEHLEKAKGRAGKAAKGRLAEHRKACQSDIDKLCKDVKLGGGRVLKCLKEHESELSAACKETFSKRAPKAAEKAEKPADTGK